ncbi:Leucine-, isoleucine-, valine-, threonine-, and alanine-binding protein precursor [Variovorax sp. SRS16]|uniref:ABC transporter substrate-binding protein n=1 Tax=Variovorax sp. SRS16 TaxID=282217 RepID=UPI001317CF22|nr:ABC transporter substrate-binding protein [Variovorax sp. SRS16]VTU23678.1 Leucine-, isoleucine-, valine-, threonine-, and alanine-binding protein precursor [Variovorax sp. SRS16]
MSCFPGIPSLRAAARCVLVAMAGAGAFTLAAAEAAEPIKIGIIAPMSGPNARYGAFANKGAALAAKEINDAGGLLGRKLELVSGDSQCVPAEGVAATQRMISLDKTPIIIGDVCSSVTLAMEPLVEESKVLLVNAASSNPDITYKAGVGGFKWTFRNYPTDEVRAATVLEYAVKTKGFKKFAVLSVDSDYGRGAIKFTKRYLPKYEGAEILSEDYYKDSETDFRSVLSKIRRSGAQAIILYGQADTTPIIARQMLELGLAGKVALVGNGEFNTKETIAAAPKVMNGAVEAAAWLPEVPAPRSLKFVEDYKKAYGGEMPNNHAYTHYDTLQLVAQAIRNAKSAKGEDVRNALAVIKYDSPMGVVTFDDHNQAVQPMVLLEIVDGKPVIKGTITTKVDYGTAAK